MTIRGIVTALLTMSVLLLTVSVSRLPALLEADQVTHTVAMGYVFAAAAVAATGAALTRGNR